MEVSHLSFSPLPGLAPLLDKLRFQLPHGARLSFFGVNGAGKSALLQLLSSSGVATAGALFCGAGDGGMEKGWSRCEFQN